MTPLDVMIKLPAGTVWTLVADRARVTKVPSGSSKRPGPCDAESAEFEGARAPPACCTLAEPPVALLPGCPAVGWSGERRTCSDRCCSVAWFCSVARLCSVARFCSVAWSCSVARP
jgi:hypothetical protein